MLLLLAVLFVAARTWSSVSLGGSIAAGLRSGIIGVLLCGLVLLIMKALSKRPLADRFGALSLPPAKAWAGLVGVVLLYLFELGAIMDQLQRAGYVAGPPIYDAIPGWGGMVAALERVGAAVTRWVPGVESYMFVSMIRGGIVFVLLPMLLLVLLGLRRGDFAAGGGDIKPALPLSAVCVAAFVADGVTVEKVLLFLYFLLHVGIQQEFFFRGAMQPLLSGALQSPVLGIGFSVMLFALLHAPDFVLRVYSAPGPAVGSVATVAMFGLLMSYGAYRSGMLWPWMLIHALSRVLG